MPTDMSKYPDNWQEIRNTVLLRAGGQEGDPRIGACCEVCGVENYAVGYRDHRGDFKQVRRSDSYKNATSIAERRNAEAERSEHHWQKVHYIVIVLTIAHWHDHNPMNCDLDNLKAVCQRCHNLHDSRMRARHRKENKQ